MYTSVVIESKRKAEKKWGKMINIYYTISLLPLEVQSQKKKAKISSNITQFHLHCCCC